MCKGSGVVACLSSKIPAYGVAAMRVELTSGTSWDTVGRVDVPRGARNGAVDARHGTRAYDLEFSCLLTFMTSPFTLLP